MHYLNLRNQSNFLNHQSLLTLKLRPMQIQSTLHITSKTITKMTRAIVIIAVICWTGISAAVPSYPVYINPYPEHRGDINPLKAIDDIPSNAYEYHIIPSDGYPLAEFDSSAQWSILDYIPSPITAITKVASKALSVTKWFIINGGLVVLGMALVIGFCAFTPYCTLIIEKPFARKIRSLNIPYLDDVELYLKEAYTKYHAMQED
ncbi:uncharacterized protein LOC131852019 [Achroia grisella]|uniref:uncharacterized protein LOC131852019 n=1 Tax=Achroia grisella TaxID=688607 RepID=UPI0027D26C41|nr:uncharacterized protein LOC131852019 [Achroia grisella]